MGTAVAPAAWPCSAGCLGGGRKPTAAQMTLSVSSYVQGSLPEGRTWARDLEPPWCWRVPAVPKVWTWRFCSDADPELPLLHTHS